MLPTPTAYHMSHMVTSHAQRQMKRPAISTNQTYSIKGNYIHEGDPYEAEHRLLIWLKWKGYYVVLAIRNKIKIVPQVAFMMLPTPTACHMSHMVTSHERGQRYDLQ